MKLNGYNFLVFELYRDSCSNTNKRLINQHGGQSNASLHLFGQRLLKVERKTILENVNVSDEVTIKNLQYPDSGSFCAQFFFGSSGKEGLTLNSTVKLDVTGTECIFCIFLYFYQSEKMNNPVKRFQC